MILFDLLLYQFLGFSISVFRLLYKLLGFIAVSVFRSLDFQNVI